MLDGNSTHVATTRGRDVFVAQNEGQTYEIKILRQEQETVLQAEHHRSMLMKELLVLDAVSNKVYRGVCIYFPNRLPFFAEAALVSGCCEAGCRVFEVLVSRSERISVRVQKSIGRCTRLKSTSVCMYID